MINHIIIMSGCLLQSQKTGCSSTLKLMIHSLTKHMKGHSNTTKFKGRAKHFHSFHCTQFLIWYISTCLVHLYRLRTSLHALYIAWWILCSLAISALPQDSPSHPPLGFQGWYATNFGHGYQKRRSSKKTRRSVGFFFRTFPNGIVFLGM